MNYLNINKNLHNTKAGQLYPGLFHIIASEATQSQNFCILLFDFLFSYSSHALANALKLRS